VVGGRCGWRPSGAVLCGTNAASGHGAAVEEHGPGGKCSFAYYGVDNVLWANAWQTNDGREIEAQAFVQSLRLWVASSIGARPAMRTDGKGKLKAY
jgi:hypothetical protein